LIALRDVTYAFETRPVVDAVTLDVPRGELVCVVGANGAGKTTLLRLVAGFVAPSSGTVRIDGLDPARVARRQLSRRLAFLPQEYHLAFPFTVGEVVLMGRYPHRGALALESDEDARLAMAAMVRCDVGWLASRRFDALSGGERRRALLAQAFCQAAELLLLDEPTASLDPAHAVAVFQILAEEKKTRGATAIVVTHDLNLAARFADRIVVLHGGKVVANGAPDEVLASAATQEAYGVRLHVGKLGDIRFVVPLDLEPPK
jgi:iron complex transport system ATP-binding protein